MKGAERPVASHAGLRDQRKGRGECQKGQTVTVRVAETGMNAPPWSDAS